MSNRLTRRPSSRTSRAGRTADPSGSTGPPSAVPPVPTFVAGPSRSAKSSGNVATKRVLPSLHDRACLEESNPFGGSEIRGTGQKRTERRTRRLLENGIEQISRLGNRRACPHPAIQPASSWRKTGLLLARPHRHRSRDRRSFARLSSNAPTALEKSTTHLRCCRSRPQCHPLAIPQMRVFRTPADRELRCYIPVGSADGSPACRHTGCAQRQHPVVTATGSRKGAKRFNVGTRASRRRHFARSNLADNLFPDFGIRGRRTVDPLKNKIHQLSGGAVACHAVLIDGRCVRRGLRVHKRPSHPR